MSPANVAATGVSSSLNYFGVPSYVPANAGVMSPANVFATDVWPDANVWNYPSFTPANAGVMAPYNVAAQSTASPWESYFPSRMDLVNYIVSLIK
jgi:hypothetical protein